MSSERADQALPSDRRGLVDGLISLVGHREGPHALALRERLERYVDGLSEVELARLVERIATTGGGWGYHPPDPVARELSHLVHGLLLEPGSRLEGVERFEAARSAPAILLANHLAFDDANLLEHMLSEAGYGDVAARLTALVGPKVFTHPLRRVASLAFGTIKIPQSQSRASGEAVMPPREAARITVATIAAARERLNGGDALLIFVEGTRSRSGSMQRALAGVERYLEVEGAVLIPLGIEGSERVTPIGDATLHPTRVTIRAAPTVPAERLLAACSRRRQLCMDVAGLLIAAALPDSYRGVYGGDEPALGEARAIARAFAS
jgi:1-acyl-sn-glycerol-3-phosphate acyltransferase